MADAESQREDNPSETSPEITVTIKPSSAETKYTITVPLSMTAHELKQRLSTAEYANVPPERQRLIYSGRVLKDPDTLESYKIKEGNTIHMVKSAAPSTSSTSAPSSAASSVPASFASGPGNDPLTGLTGARYAGHVQLPGAGMFGPDGGMGPPPDPAQMMEMMNSPGTSEAINQMMSNPQVIEQMMRHPMFQGNPRIRQALQNPEMRRQMFSPEAIRQALQLQRSMQEMGMGNMGMGMGMGMGGAQANPAFPAPGATEQTAEGQRASGASNPPTTGMPGAGAFGANPLAAMFGPAGQFPNPMQAGNPAQTGSDAPPNPVPNPFAAFFGSPPAANAGSAMQDSPFGNPAAPSEGGQANPFGLPPYMMQQMMQAQQTMAAQEAADTRPPEVRYEEQLQQLNAMGLHDFERNVAALRRSGGNVQAAIEYLFSS